MTDPRTNRVASFLASHGWRLPMPRESSPSSAELLERTRPRTALVPVGDRNRFGHPHHSVGQQLGAAGITVYRTDRDGDVRLVIRPDGSVSAESSR